ncbi:MAG: DegV family protein [Aerococcus sp.]|nr:DegV family protein [Aerococcus sp.]
MKAAIITDSSATLSKDIASLPNVYQVYLTIRFSDGEEFIDSSDADQLKAYYQKLAADPGIPKTAQPTIQQYYDAYDAIIDAGYDTVFVFTLSGQLSGTNQTANVVAREMSDRIESHVIDTHSTSFVMECMIKDTLASLEAGEDAEAIVKKMEWLSVNSPIYFIVDNLDYLRKSGRLTGVAAFVGKTLSIMPILKFLSDGRVDVIEKVRTSKKAIRHLADHVEEALANYPEGIRLIAAHGEALDKMEMLLKELETRFGQDPVRTGYVTPVVGAYGGPGCLGLGIIPSLNNFSD